MATRRTARICIRNNTEHTLKAVCLRHRGSDGREHVKQWSDVAASTITAALDVDYENGLVTKGTDYWLVTWVYADGREVYVTDPRNVSEAVDATRVRLAAAVPDLERRLSSALTGVKAEEVVDAFADGVANDACPAGWKEHPLGAAEADRTMTVEIEPDHQVVFRSRSAESRSPTVATTLRDASVPDPTLVA